MVGIDPYQQFRPHRIPVIDDPVAVASVFRLIENSKSEETVLIAGVGLCGDVSKEVFAAVDIAISISI